MNNMVLDDIDEIINSLSSPESGYESPERPDQHNEVRAFYISYGNEIGPHLEIMVQPQSSYRFRYITEFKDNPHGPLTGENSTKSNKTFPSVKLNNYSKKAIIRCWLCVNFDKQVHIHQLLTKNDGRGIRSEPHDIIVDTKNNFTAVFEGLNIIHAVTKGKKEYFECFHKKKTHIQSGYYSLSSENSQYDEKALKQEIKFMEKNKAVLFFEAFDFETHEKISETFSNEIKNSKNPKTSTLKIARQSIKKGGVQGGTEVMIFVEKVTKDIKIHFFEVNESEQITWEDYAKIEEVWHQVGIAFRTPNYKNLNIDKETKVYFKLIRESDGSISNEMEYYYQPDCRNQSNYIEPAAGKKRRIEQAYSFEFSPSNVSDYKSDGEISQYAFEEPPLFVTQNASPLKEVYLNSPEELETLTGLLGDSICVDPNSFEEQIYLPTVFDSDSATTISESKLELFADSAKSDVEASLAVNEENDGYKLASALFKYISERCNSRFFYETLKKIQRNKMNLNEFRNAYNKTPLHMAIEKGRLDFVQPLINAGVDVNAVDEDSNTALHLVILCNEKSYIISNLLLAGADQTLQNDDGEAPIHISCRLKLSSHLNLLDNINDHSKKNGDTPLIIAVKYGYFEIAQSLLEKEAAIDGANYAELTPLYYAVNKEDEKLVELIITYINSNEKERYMYLIESILYPLESTKIRRLLSNCLYSLTKDADQQNQEDEEYEYERQQLIPQEYELCKNMKVKCSLKV